jgi:predicted HNH restriction endonuclease
MFLVYPYVTHTSNLKAHITYNVHADDIIHTKVANASAWTRRSDDTSGLEESVHSSGPSSTSGTVNHEGLTAADLWTLGASELVAAQARERERKLDVRRHGTC